MQKNRKFLKRFLGFIALFASLSFFCSQTLYADTDEPLPKFDVPTLTGGARLSNQDFIGKVSLLNVWGSWCKYCYYEHPMLMKIKKDFKVAIYGLDLKDDRDRALTWLQRHGNPYEKVGEDADGNVADALQVYGTPLTLVIDKHGHIRYRYSGSLDESDWKDTVWPLIQKLETEK